MFSERSRGGPATRRDGSVLSTPWRGAPLMAFGLGISLISCLSPEISGVFVCDSDNDCIASARCLDGVCRSTREATSDVNEAGSGGAQDASPSPDAETAPPITLSLRCEAVAVVGRPTPFDVQPPHPPEAGGYTWSVEGRTLSDVEGPMTHTFSTPGMQQVTARVEARGARYEGRCAIWVNAAEAPVFELLAPYQGQRALVGEEIEVALRFAAPEAVATVEVRLDERQVAYHGRAVEALTVPSPLDADLDAPLSLWVVVTDREGHEARSGARRVTLENSPPIATFTAHPQQTPDGLIVFLNAASTLDERPADLEFRWDFEGDGAWDTSWSRSGVASYIPQSPGLGLTPALQARDHAGLIDEARLAQPATPLSLPSLGERPPFWEGLIVITEPLLIPEGRIVTIRPGTTVLFFTTGGPGVTMLDVQGTLRVEGSAEAPVRFAGFDEGVRGRVRLAGPPDYIEHAIFIGGAPSLTVHNSSQLVDVHFVNAHGVALSLEGADGVHAERLRVERAAATGIEARGVTGARLDEITVMGCGEDGLRLLASADVEVQGARLVDNSGHGLTLDAASTGATLSGVLSARNGLNGFALQAATSMRDCEGVSNGRAGLYANAGRQTIQRSAFSGNQAWGLEVEHPASVDLSQALIEGNQGAGIYFRPAWDADTSSVARVGLVDTIASSLITLSRFERNGWGDVEALYLIEAPPLNLNAQGAEAPLIERWRAPSAPLAALRLDVMRMASGHVQISTPAHPRAPRALSSGRGFACALRHDETIECWGDAPQLEPLPPPGRFEQIASGEAHLCALDAAGQALCWGASSPPEGLRLSQLSAGGERACGLSQDGGQVVCWHPPGESEAAPSSAEGVALAIGEEIGCVLDSQRALLSYWRWPNAGLMVNLYASPMHYEALAAGRAHCCWLFDHGHVDCAGDQLPAHLTPPDGLVAQALAAAEDYACALGVEGHPICWGDRPFTLSTTDALTQLSAGADHLCAITVKGDVDCWGLAAPALGQAAWITDWPEARVIVAPIEGDELLIEAREANVNVAWGYAPRRVSALSPQGAHVIFDGLSEGLDARGNHWGGEAEIYDPRLLVNDAETRHLFLDEVGARRQGEDENG
ncbi:right-handed parallel beta-helix repeat-containing protein [Myxococcota bacterium]|nr:right-handed parallel beta-helix repeat-containing protein [Myxococcota bacterium]MBU1900603.1 right-handed parallel beta-helix repeat-containing protein [Myxococcota bacterium]